MKDESLKKRKLSSNESPVFASLKEVVMCVKVNSVMDRVSRVMVSQKSMLVLMVLMLMV